MEKALMFDSPDSRHLREKVVTMLKAKGNGARIHVRHAGNTAYVDEDIPPVEEGDTFDPQLERLRLRVRLAQTI
jgi:hypothetical protein